MRLSCCDACTVDTLDVWEQMCSTVLPVAALLCFVQWNAEANIVGYLLFCFFVLAQANVARLQEFELQLPEALQAAWNCPKVK